MSGMGDDGYTWSSVPISMVSSKPFVVVRSITRNGRTWSSSMAVSTRSGQSRWRRGPGDVADVAKLPGGEFRAHGNAWRRGRERGKSQGGPGTPRPFRARCRHASVFDLVVGDAVRCGVPERDSGPTHPWRPGSTPRNVTGFVAAAPDLAGLRELARGVRTWDATRPTARNVGPHGDDGAELE